MYFLIGLVIGIICFIILIARSQIKYGCFDEEDFFLSFLISIPAVLIWPIHIVVWIILMSRFVIQDIFEKIINYVSNNKIFKRIINW